MTNKISIKGFLDVLVTDKNKKIIGFQRHRNLVVFGGLQRFRNQMTAHQEAGGAALGAWAPGQFFARNASGVNCAIVGSHVGGVSAGDSNLNSLRSECSSAKIFDYNVTSSPANNQYSATDLNILANGSARFKWNYGTNELTGTTIGEVGLYDTFTAGRQLLCRAVINPIVKTTDMSVAFTYVLSFGS